MLNKVRLLTPGPTPLPERVRLTLARDMIHHRKSEFKAIMGRVQEKLRVLFGTQGTVLPLSCSGTGAMTAAVYGLFNPGEKVLVVEAGKFGQRWKAIAVSRGLEVVTLEVPWGRAVRPEQVEEALAADPAITGVLIQLSETSTGVLHPVGEVAWITRQRDVLLVVDGISAVGLSPCPLDEWGLDCLLAERPDAAAGPGPAGPLGAGLGKSRRRDARLFLLQPAQGAGICGKRPDPVHLGGESDRGPG